jgi:predicted GIY-YIG superfamily endonuclease
MSIPVQRTIIIKRKNVKKPANIQPIIDLPITTDSSEPTIITIPVSSIDLPVTKIKPLSIVIGSKIMFRSEELLEYDSIYFLGFARMRNLIEKKKMNSEDYLFAYQKKDEWILTIRENKKSKFFISEEWVLNNVTKMMPNYSENDIQQYQELPSLLTLNNDEKFKDKNGFILEIEVRGERDCKLCYFKVKDVSIAFDMPNIGNIINTSSRYERNIDFKCFISRLQNLIVQTTNSKQLFLTYNGMMKLLYSSHNANARYIQSWATEKLFTIQMGEQDKKEELSACLLGVNVKAIKDVFHANTSKTPCVYLYYVGNAKELLPNSNFTDDDLLCKYGCTDDFPRRSTEHEKHFHKEFDKKIELLSFSIIESQYIFAAETCIKQYFKSNIIEYKNSTELIVINKRDLNSIKQQYCMIQNSYIGRYEEMYRQIIQLKEKLKDKDIELIMKDKEIENEINKFALILKDKEFQLLSRDKDIEVNLKEYQIQLKDKDIEVLKFQIQLMQK